MQAVPSRTARAGGDAPAVVTRSVLGMTVHATSYADATARICGWAERREARYVCVSSVNNVMIAHDDPSFMRVMNEADLVTPDGVPLVWALRLLGVRDASRVYGPDLTLHLLAEAERRNIPIGLYGGTPSTLETLLATLRRRFPGLRVPYAYSPPFRPLDDDETDSVRREIVESGAGILLVGIGCPAQERWMAAQVGALSMPLVGVGAAFDFIAGVKRQAPSWLQKMGLEWLFRLLSEPRRLWRRYLFNNPRFALFFGRQLLVERARGRKS